MWYETFIAEITFMLCLNKLSAIVAKCNTPGLIPAMFAVYSLSSRGKK